MVRPRIANPLFPSSNLGVAFAVKNLKNNYVKVYIQYRKKDFELIFLMKELNAYIFISESDNFNKLRR